MAGFQVVISSLRRTEAQLEKQLESVRSAITSLAGGGAGTKSKRGRPKGSGKKRGRRKGAKMSAAARKKISDAQKKRWADKRAEKK